MPVPSLPWLSPLAPRVAPGVAGGDAGCPVLTRLSAYVVDRGVVPVLAHTVRDPRTGRPLDLSPVADHPGWAETDPAAAAAVVRADDWPAGGCDAPPVFPAYFDQPADLAAGRLAVPVPPAVVDRPGLYRLTLLVRDTGGRAVRSDVALLSVERGPVDSAGGFAPTDGSGVPTVRELRAALLDSGPADNLRLDDVEFADDQLLRALAWPVDYWNEALPRVAPHTARSFPYRAQWLDAACGRLHEEAAHHYRRNRRGVRADGLADNDLDREREYLAEAERRLARYKAWVAATKRAISHDRAWGGVG